MTGSPIEKLVIALSTSGDSLLFDDHERDPDDDLRLQSKRSRLSDG